MSTDRRNLASIEITQRCNGNCPYCDQIKSDRDISVSEFGQIPDNLIEAGVDAVAWAEANQRCTLRSPNYSKKLELAVCKPASQPMAALPLW